MTKETLLFPHDSAQGSYRRFLRAQQCTSQKVGISSKKTSMYKAPDSMVFPFASKAFMSVKQALREDKPLPHLKEYEAVSLLAPNESEDWKACADTFVPGKLEPEIAQRQFSEDVPSLPQHLIKAEFEARNRLAQALSTQSMCEFGIHMEPNSEMLKLLAKQHLFQFSEALHAFGTARRACRKHIFQHATVRHEPDRLINSSIWGDQLFPAPLVAEVRDRAATADKSLLAKWGMRKTDRKRSRSSSSTPQSKRFKHHGQYHPSPAYNRNYEREDQSFRGQRKDDKRSRKPPRGRGGKRGGGDSGRSPHEKRGGRGGARGGRGGRGGAASHQPASSGSATQDREQKQ